jgi:hypothetical protein
VEVAVEAMRGVQEWQPPRQNAARRHSVFVDVELWDVDARGHRIWSCAMLASVWQVLRLGLLRDHGRTVAQPVDVPSEWPDSWADLPPVVRLQQDAAPFAAYTTVSLLSPRFLLVEAAVRTVLSQFVPESRVVQATIQRAARERVELTDEVVDRIRYVFSGSGRSEPA